MAGAIFSGASAASAAQKTWDMTTGTWNTTALDWLVAGTTTPTVAFTSGDDAVFSNASTYSALTLGQSLSAGNFDSNGAATPTTTTITGAAGFTLTLGTGTAGSGNISDVAGTGTSYAQNLTYTLSGTGSAFNLAAGSGTTAAPTIWNIASGKTFTVSAATTGQASDLGSNLVNITGAGTVDLTSGLTVSNGTFNVSNGYMEFAGGGSHNTTINSSVTVNVLSGGTEQLQANSGTGSTFGERVCYIEF